MCCCLLDGIFTHFLQKSGATQMNSCDCTSPSDVVAVVLLRRMHPIIVELPPLFGALSAPLILLWNSRGVLVL